MNNWKQVKCELERPEWKIKTNDHETKCFRVNHVKQEQASFLNNQADAAIIQIYSVIKLYMFRATSMPIIRHW